MRRSLLAAVVLVGGVLVSPRSAEAADLAPEVALEGVQSVAVGYDHSCAVLTNRQVRCWGSNYYGELGNNSSTVEFFNPVVARNASGTGPLRNVVQLALGDYHTCALLTTGQVRCWGGNGEGQLGTGDGDDAPLPRVVRNAGDTGPLVNVRSISANAQGTCALLTNGEVRCWGADAYGQLGNGMPEESASLPVVVKGLNGAGRLTGITSLGGGLDNNCAVTSGGQGRCWGRQGEGALGNGGSSDSAVPVRVRRASSGTPLTGITQISQGGYHGCARLSNGQARCWGNNTEGELGTGGTNDNGRAVVVRRADGSPLSGVRSIFAGADSTCAAVAAGQARCWGDDDNGETGDGTFESPDFRKRPGPVVSSSGTGTLTGIRQLAGKTFHYCVTQTNGRVRCWGYNAHGGLGYGDDEHQPKPVLVQI
jgi:alpha-tubulin suppressor-like RCC1 family protein